MNETGGLTGAREEARFVEAADLPAVPVLRVDFFAVANALSPYQFFVLSVLYQKKKCLPQSKHFFDHGFKKTYSFTSFGFLPVLSNTPTIF